MSTLGPGGVDVRTNIMNLMRLRGNKEEYHVPVTCPEPAAEDTDWVLKDLNFGLLVGEKPSKLTEGVGGAYLFRDATGQAISVFKPLDEEAGAPGNVTIRTDGRVCTYSCTLCMPGWCSLLQYLVLDTYEPMYTFSNTLRLTDWRSLLQYIVPTHL